MAQAETPAESVDRVWNAFGYDPAQKNYKLPPSFVELSQQVAHEQGEAVIPPIMARSNDWSGSEAMAFTQLLQDLPPAKANLILEHYKMDGTQSEKHYASVFLDLILLHERAQKKMAEIKAQKAAAELSP